MNQRRYDSLMTYRNMLKIAHDTGGVYSFGDNEDNVIVGVEFIKALKLAQLESLLQGIKTTSEFEKEEAKIFQQVKEATKDDLEELFTQIRRSDIKPLVNKVVSGLTEYLKGHVQDNQFYGSEVEIGNETSASLKELIKQAILEAIEESP